MHQYSPEKGAHARVCARVCMCVEEGGMEGEGRGVVGPEWFWGDGGRVSKKPRKTF